MKVRMKIPVSGRRADGQRWPAVGETITVPDREGKHLCEQGYADPVATKPSKQTEAREFPKHQGGGWYELSDGSTVRGKEEAEEAEAKL